MYKLVKKPRKLVFLSLNDIISGLYISLFQIKPDKTFIVLKY